jgi:hypothetical protein
MDRAVIASRSRGRRMRIGRIVALSVLFAACATPPPPPPPPTTPATAPARSVDYLKTLSGGWRIRLTDDHRAATACQYGLTVGPARPFDKTLYLRAEFENPLSPSSPLVTDTKIEPWMRELAIRSPEVRGLRKGGRYRIRIHIYDHPLRKHEIGYHDQMMPARLNVNSDGSVSF